MTEGLTPADRERLARVRFTMLAAMRASGFVLMMFGIWIWFGDLVRFGGYPPVGMPLFVLGVAEATILPRILARRWRSPR